MPRSDTYFKKGNPGGPGRPPGSRTKASLLIEKILDKKLTRKAVEAMVGAAIHQFITGKPGAFDSLGRIGLTEMPRILEHAGLDRIPTRFTLVFDKFNENGHENGAPELSAPNGNGSNGS